MATNIAEGWKGEDYIAVRAWYNGKTPATHCEFFCAGSLFATDYYKSGSGTDTNWTTDYQIKDGLSPGTSYSFFAIFRGSGNSVLGVTDSISIRTDKAAAPPPPKPKNLKATILSSTSIKLNWSSSSGADYYYIHKDGGYFDETYNNFYTFYSLKENETYEFCVSAVGNGAESDLACVSATTMEPPARPTGLKFTRLSTTSLRLSWNPVSNAYGYDIYTYDDNDNEIHLAYVSGTSYDVTGLSPTKNYGFCVSSYNSGGNSSKACINATTMLPPTTPTDLILTVLSTTSIKLSWNPVTNSMYYNIYVNGVYRDYTTTALTYTVTGLTVGATYQFCVSSENIAGESSQICIGGSTRPEDWNWNPSIQVGKSMQVYSSGGTNYYYLMPATEWNNFLVKINQFRTTLGGLNAISFTTYKVDDKITVSMYNIAASAINDMSSHFTGGQTPIPLKTINTGKLTYADLQKLKNTLNSIY